MRGSRDTFPTLLFVLGIGIALSGCAEIPSDPEHTLRRIHETGQLRVGVSARPPWTNEISQPGLGIEGKLLKQWAEENDVEVTWREATERDLIDWLEHGKIDVAIAGFTKDTPWSKRAGMTQPYLERPDGKHVMLVRKGENRWLLELDRFLQTRRPELALILEARPAP